MMRGFPPSPLLLALGILVFVTACSSDGSSLVTSQAEERVSSALIMINPIIREHDSTSERAMDLLFDLKQLRSVDATWTEKYRRNITVFGSTAAANDLPGVMERIRVLWQKDQRDDLRVEADQIKSILSQLQISRTRLSNASANVPAFGEFRQTSLLAIDLQIRIIEEIDGWYQGFMTRAAGESFTRELITMFDDAPTRFLDARLRWDSAKSDLSR